MAHIKAWWLQDTKRREDQSSVIVGGEGKTITDVAQGNLNLVFLSLALSFSLLQHLSDPIQMAPNHYHQKATTPASFLLSTQAAPLCSSLRLTIMNPHADGHSRQLISAGNGTQSTSSSSEMFLCSPLHWLADGDVKMWGNSAGIQPGPLIIISLGRPQPRWNESFPLLHCSWTPGSLQRVCLFVQQSNQGVCHYKT